MTVSEVISIVNGQIASLTEGNYLVHVTTSDTVNSIEIGVDATGTLRVIVLAQAEGGEMLAGESVAVISEGMISGLFNLYLHNDLPGAAGYILDDTDVLSIDITGVDGAVVTWKIHYRFNEIVAMEGFGS